MTPVTASQTSATLSSDSQSHRARDIRVSGEGDEFVIVGRVRYPNGEIWHGIQFTVVRDGKIARVTAYLGAPFDAPEWRARYVERIE